MENIDITYLIGKTLVEATYQDKELILNCGIDGKYIMYHSQDCCEVVYLEDVCPGLDVLKGEILHAYKSSSKTTVNSAVENTYVKEGDSFTWTFYTIITENGSATLRWFGCTNGYYAVEVDIRHEPLKMPKVIKGSLGLSSSYREYLKERFGKPFDLSEVVLTDTDTI